MALDEQESELNQLDQIHERLVRALECLALDYSGEARGELAGVWNLVLRSDRLTPTGRDQLLAALRVVNDELRSDSDSRVARTASRINALRHRIRNAICLLQGRAQEHDGAEPIHFG